MILRLNPANYIFWQNKVFLLIIQKQALTKSACLLAQTQFILFYILALFRCSYLKVVSCFMYMNYLLWLPCSFLI